MAFKKKAAKSEKGFGKALENAKKGKGFKGDKGEKGESFPPAKGKLKLKAKKNGNFPQ